MFPQRANNLQPQVFNGTQIWFTLQHDLAFEMCALCRNRTNLSPVCTFCLQHWKITFAELNYISETGALSDNCHVLL
jgi:hypothetical protein